MKVVIVTTALLVNVDSVKSKVYTYSIVMFLNSFLENTIVKQSIIKS